MFSQSKNILLAEDEPQVRNMLVTILRGNGYNVLEAINGKEALKMAKDHEHESIDLLLSDVVMPYINGTEVAYQFRNMFPHTPIILMSGWTENVEITDAHFVAVVNKPFLIEDLIEQIENVIS